MVSAVHRYAAWLAGIEALEACKAEVEVWKWEEFQDNGDVKDRKEGNGARRVN